MKTQLFAVVLLSCVLSVRGDDGIANVQQALKDQGFYYGEITGEKNSDTTAAVRRFQIRNGLQVTGELDGETLRTLGTGNARQPVAKATQPPSETIEHKRELVEAPENQPGEQIPANPPVAAPPIPPDGTGSSARPSRPEPQSGPLFVGTPYETAPPEAQRNVIVSAQSALVRRGLYHDAIDGIYGANMEFSLRAFQARVGLRTTGRLDLETLAALELLPGAHAPIYVPRRRVYREEPVRGQWIPE